jgi:hypothetical protein
MSARALVTISISQRFEHVEYLRYLVGLFGEPLELADEIAYMLTSCLDIVVGNCLGGSVTYHPSTNSDQNDHENGSTTGERRSLMRD